MLDDGEDGLELPAVAFEIGEGGRIRDGVHTD